MSADLIDLASLRPLFAPETVAVIGASTDADKIGGLPVHYMKLHGYGGRILPVNPRAAEVQGLPAVPNIGAIDGPVDLAIVAVPGALVEDAVRQCADKGVKGLVMFSSGFAEVSADGAAAQARLTDIVRESGMRLMGPNCMGMMNFTDRLAATFHPSFRDGMSEPGGIGMVSQSGAFGGIAYMMGRDRGLNFSLIATTGNEADVDVADCLAYLAEDPATKVILLYMEGCRNGPKLLAALDLAHANDKPIVAIKLGSTAAGAAAAASHTAALAGEDAVFDALFRQYGVYRAHSLEEFFDIGAACVIGKPPPDDSVGIITVSGGVGVLMADAAAHRGLDVAPLPRDVQAEIKAMVPFAGVGNPVDVTGQVVNDFGLFDRTVDLVLNRGGYGAVVTFQGAAARSYAREDHLTEMWVELAGRHREKQLAVTGLASPAFEAAMAAAGVLCYEEPTHAMRALAALAGFGGALKRRPRGPDPKTPASPLGPGPFNEAEALAIAGAAGVPVIETASAASADEAVAAAARFGGPVALKVLSADIVHKSEIGGVRLNLSGAGAIRRAFREIIATTSAGAPGARIAGCLVAPMAPGDGIECILGLNRDPVFGPVVMFGLGGIFVESLRDVCFRIAPIDEAEAARMVREIKAFPILQGQRGAPPADLEALAAALAALSRFGAAQGDSIESLDLNPFIVRPRGQGALALDAALLVRGSNGAGPA